MTVRLPLWAGPDSGVYQEMPSELRCCSDCAARFRLEEMLACVYNHLCTPPVCKKNMTILCTWDHLLFVRPPMWAGPDRIKLFVLV